MTHRKFIRAATALLMVLAFTLPLAPSALANHEDQGVYLRPVVIGGTLDINGDTAVNGKDDSNSFFGNISIIDGKVDCNNDLAITGADDCVLAPHNATPITVTDGVLSAPNGPLPGIWAIPDVAWRILNGLVDSDGNGSISSNDCTRGIIGLADDAGIGADFADAVNVLGSNGATDPCTGLAFTDTTANGKIDLNNSNSITAADSCTNGCFFGLNVLNGVVVTSIDANSISPNTGPASGGTTVTLSGTFQGVAPTDTNTTVTFGGTPGTSLDVTGTTGTTSGTFTLTVKSPAGTAGATVAVVTSNPNGSDATPLSFTYAAAPPAAVCGAGVIEGTVTGTQTPGDPPGAGGVLAGVSVVVVVKATGQVLGPVVTNAAGFYSITGVPTNSVVRITFADNSNDYGDGADSTVSNPRGHLISSTEFTTGAGCNTVNQLLVTKLSPGTAAAGQAGVFGYAVDPSTGNGVSGATIEVRQGGSVIKSATTDSTGRFEINGLPAGVDLEVRLVGTFNCLVCTDTVTLVALRWKDPAFLAIPGLARKLEAVVPLVAESPDTSRTGGVDFNSRQLRIANAGAIRTGVEVAFHNSDTDGRRTGTETEIFDINPGAVAIVSGNLIPSGLLGQAEIFSIDHDGSDPIFGLGDLQVTVTYDVATAGGAEAGTNGINTEDFVVSADAPSRMVVFPVLYKNYGGGVHQHSSVGQICLTTGVPARQPVVMRFWPIGDTRGGPWFETRSIDPGGCITFNTRDLGFLPDKSTFALAVTSTGTLGPIAGAPAADFRPGGASGGSISYSTTGKVATASNAYSTPTGETRTGELELFAGLVFHKNRGWNSGLAVTNFTETGESGSASISVVIYDEAGRLMCTLGDRVSNERALVFYTPRLACALPDNFQGTAIVRGSEVSARARPFVTAMHVNYDQWQMISYNATRQDALVGPEAIGARPCAADGFVTCMWVTEALKQSDGRGNPSGPNTGIRIFNPRGGTATVTVSWFDSSGVEFIDARTTVTLPGFGTLTYFTPHLDELPPFWTGGARIVSTAEVVGLGQVRDYSASGRDGSRAFNLPNQTGKTQ